MKNGDKDYHKMQNQNRITLRLTAEELAILEIEMAEEGYECRTTFIKGRLFGQLGEKRRKKKQAVIKSRDNYDIATILKRYILEMAAWFHYTYLAIKKLFEKEVEESKKKDFALDKLVTLSSHTKKIATLFAAVCHELNIPVAGLINDDLSKTSESEWLFDEHTDALRRMDVLMLASGQFRILENGKKIITVCGVVIGTPKNESGNVDIGVIILECKSKWADDYPKYLCRLAKNLKVPEIGESVIVTGALSIFCGKDKENRTLIKPVISVILLQLNR